jgi:hypothetical protein
VLLSHIIGTSCDIVGEYYTKRVSEQDELRGVVPQPAHTCVSFLRDSVSLRNRIDGAFVVFDLCSRSSIERVNLHQFKCPVVLVGLRSGRRTKGVL